MPQCGTVNKYLNIIGKIWDRPRFYRGSMKTWSVPENKEGLADIEAGLQEIISEVSKKYPLLPILTHSYDYPRPLVGSGKYI